jgi:uncharacterized repeat protein (TIGR01451 family)
MSVFRQTVRQGSSLAFASFLVVTSSRVGAQAPDAGEIAKKWGLREPLEPADVRQRVRDLTGRELNARQSERLERFLGRDRTRGRRPGALTPGGTVAGFHAGATGAPELAPQNPLLDPLGLFDGEAGEEPVIGPTVRMDLADFDGDGDLDAFVGDKYGVLRYFENVAGPGAEPVYEERLGAASPVGGLDLTTPEFPDPFNTAPTLVDIDGDGDLDLFVGLDYSYFAEGGVQSAPVLFFENDGSGNLVRNDADNPLGGFVFDVYAPMPRFADVDQDGDFDAFIGAKLQRDIDNGEIVYLENVGDAMNPMFVDQTDVFGEDPFAGVMFEVSTAIGFGDVDGDDDNDAFIADFRGVRFFEDQTATPGLPMFAERFGADNPLFGAGFCPGVGPVVGDVDGDGDLDAFLGSGYFSKTGYGRALYLENGGTSDNPAFLTGGDRLELVDIDGDGDLDALASRFEFSYVEGSGETEVLFFENQGTAAAPAWRLQDGLDNPFFTFNAAYDYTVTGDSYYFPPSVAPTVGLLDDGDTLLDAFVGLPSGSLEYLEDDGTGQLQPAAIYGDGSLEAYDFGYDVDPQLVDVDGDGELDLVVGYQYYDEMDGIYGPRVAFFLNETGPGGIDAVPDLVLDLEDIGGVDNYAYRPAPALSDIDGDGDLDLYIGGFNYDESTYSYPALWFLENTAAMPGGLAFDVATAQALDVETSQPTSPALGDVNGDGLLDLAIGDPCGPEFFLSAAPALEVTKVVTDGVFDVGGTIEYTITIENVGAGDQPDDPANPELTDTLPDGLTLEDATVTSGPGAVTVDPGANTVRYDGAIPAGGTVTIVITATVDGGTQGDTITNQAIAFFDADLDGTNDTEEPSDDPATAEDDDGTSFVVDAAPAVLDIPTLSEWGAIIFAGLLSLAGWLGIRRMG